jgi:3-hydroxybutyryl-CoA dehydrogenase
MLKYSINTVSIVGAGTMGKGIAHTFAQYGYTTFLIDSSETALSKALTDISTNLDRQINKGIIDASSKQTILNRITPTTDIKLGAKNSDLIVEAILEVEESKKTLFKELENYAPSHCILASNTSSVPIARLAEGLLRPQRVIGMHFMNPVPVMKLVEVIEWKDTAPMVTQTILDVCYQLQKTPVVVQDLPGFISNRVLMPMINEAIYALHEGVANVEAIDTIMKLGMSHPMGPLQLADYIGLDVCLHIMNILKDGFQSDKYTPCPLLVNMVNSNELGIKTKKGFYTY